MLLIGGAALGLGDRAADGVVSTTVVRFGQGEDGVLRRTSKVKFCLVPNLFFMLRLPVGRRPRAWVGREGSLLRQQHGVVVIGPVLHPSDPGIPPLLWLPASPSVCGFSSWLGKMVLSWRCRLEFGSVCLSAASFSTTVSQAWGAG